MPCRDDKLNAPTHSPTTAQNQVCRAQAHLTDGAPFDPTLSTLIDHGVDLADQQHAITATITTITHREEGLP